MLILYFYQYYATPKGFWGTRVHDFASEWVKKGHDVTVITSVYSKSDIKANRFIEIQYFEGVKIVIINVLVDNKQLFIKRIYTFLVYAICSCWYGLTQKADVVIASSGPITVGIPALVARYLRRRKLVFEVRDLWPEGAIELGVIKNRLIKKLAYWFEKQCYKAASLVVALSIGMKEHIIQLHAHPNVIDVTNAADIRLFSIPKAFDGRGEVFPKKYAIYTGNIGEVNNSLWLLEAAKILQDKGRADIKILLVGEGQQRTIIEEEIIKYGLKTLIRWDLMPKEDLVTLVQNAMVSLVPLKGTPVLDSSSPNKFFESLTAGVPVIQNTQGWMKVFLEEHQVGFTLDPNEPSLLAELLIQLDRDPGRLKEMGKRAAVIAAKYFDKKYLAQRMLQSISRLQT